MCDFNVHLQRKSSNPRTDVAVAKRTELIYEIGENSGCGHLEMQDDRGRRLQQIII